jgi:hypothetical protein
MNTKISRLLQSLFCLSLVPASSAFALCKDQQDKHCWNLQYILYGARTDFREFEFRKPLKLSDPKPNVPKPDLSMGAVAVPCSVSTWSNAVSVYMCTADVPPADVEEWYGKTMADLQKLQYLWKFKINTSGTDHYVDAGPAGCDVIPLEKNYSDGSSSDGPFIGDGPYIGQCPLHLETVKQADGKAKVYFWLNSYSSPYLARRHDSPSKALPQSAKSQAPQSASTAASQSASDAVPAVEAAADNKPVASKQPICDELCQGLKKILEGRTSSFRGIEATSTVADRPSDTSSSGVGVKLVGAASCSVNAAPLGARTSAKNATTRAHLEEVSTKANKLPAPGAAHVAASQYVCYWSENSAAAAESQFHDLVGLVQMLMPSNWSGNQQEQPDKLSGAQTTVWTARDARNKAAVDLYLNGKSVGLHVSASD